MFLPPNTWLCRFRRSWSLNILLTRFGRPPESSAWRFRPLIVEDDPHLCKRLERWLTHDKGFKTLVAMRGAEALALAREFHPTAVSLDVFLPTCWVDSAQSFETRPDDRHIPVQMLTLDEDRQHGLARGAFAFVTKPTSPEALKEALQRIKEYSAPRRRRLLVVEDICRSNLPSGNCLVAKTSMCRWRPPVRRHSPRSRKKSLIACSGLAAS